MDRHFRENIGDIAKTWGFNPVRICNEFQIAGSPERSLDRCVFEDDNGEYYIIEKLFSGKIELKKKITDILNFLKERNVNNILNYIDSLNGDAVRSVNGNYYQIAPFIRGVELKRPDYVYDKWRGKILAEFLIDLRHKTEGTILNKRSGGYFSIVKYIEEIVDTISVHNPELTERIQPIYTFLENDLFESHNKIPEAFCHGDYHPLNIIWSDTGIKSVIDWEFTGCKPEIYDMALLVGCIGIEDPLSLKGPLVKDFISEIQKSGVVSGISWKYFIDYMIAIRFAWLSEWLRKSDHEMIELELVYMYLLQDNISYLREIWEIQSISNH